MEVGEAAPATASGTMPLSPTESGGADNDCLAGPSTERRYVRRRHGRGTRRLHREGRNPTTLELHDAIKKYIDGGAFRFVLPLRPV
ncbi:unnamed protein product [Heligmosomoides polygyrus]|uniref:UBX domain-containing protein n=1 Tax=Heligmosomoides polygyrus TaxID=6339 RepID=A0A183FX64_HELPZ|nr:unnamed protein product [Heligmosomoides polygyrus]